MKLGIPIYEGVNLLDVAGPLEMFYWANQSDRKKPNEELTTVLVSEDGKPVTSINGVRFEAQASFADVPALDILWVPGGDPDSLAAIMKDPPRPICNIFARSQQAQRGCAPCAKARCCWRAPGFSMATRRRRTGTSWHTCRSFERSRWTHITSGSSGPAIGSPGAAFPQGWMRR
jgi:hypothetical protein